MKKVFALLILVTLTTAIFAQNIDFKNWKTVEQEMFWLASKCVEHSDSEEHKTKKAHVVEASSKDGSFVCKYDTTTHTGEIVYDINAVSYSVANGFYSDLFDIKGAPTTTIPNTPRFDPTMPGGTVLDPTIYDIIMYSTWNHIPRWFHKAQRIMYKQKTVLILYFHAKDVVEYGYK